MVYRSDTPHFVTPLSRPILPYPRTLGTPGVRFSKLLFYSGGVEPPSPMRIYVNHSFIGLEPNTTLFEKYLRDAINSVLIFLAQARRS